jgi:hypothetical protein
MRTLADMLGVSPKREAVKQSDGTWLLTITPPAQTGFSASTIVLYRDQYYRYLEWRDGGKLIQDCLPELSAAQREILMTGIGPEEFDAEFADDDPE